VSAIDPKLNYPCGAVKPQPVKLKANLAHYRACADERCKARLEAYEAIRKAMAGMTIKKP
jgi:hypothetical protein